MRVITGGNPPVTIEISRETDGRWIAEIPAHPGLLAYGETPAEAHANVRALLARVLQDS